MKPVDFDNTRRHLQIMLRGQELSVSQAAELAGIIAGRLVHEKPTSASDLDALGIAYQNAVAPTAYDIHTEPAKLYKFPMPEGIAASYIETTGILPLQKQVNRIESDRTESIMFPGEPIDHYMEKHKARLGGCGP